MFRRIVFAASIAGVLAGVALTALQSWEVTPLILEAETFEDPERGAAVWGPADGWERTLYTALANSGAGIGFALLLCALYTRRERVGVPQGMLFGIAGFMVFYLGPALGLPPELPGTPAAPLVERQIWWLATVIATGCGIALLTRPAYFKAFGLAVLAAPHLVGAPHGDYGAALAPADLARRFVFAATWTNGVFWLLLGSLSAWTFQRRDRISVSSRGRA